MDEGLGKVCEMKGIRLFLTELVIDLLCASGAAGVFFLIFFGVLRLIGKVSDWLVVIFFVIALILIICALKISGYIMSKYFIE